jgi:predicted component of type VI protein secretion system
MLRLRVVSSDGKDFQTPHEVEFDEAGGSIGRRPENRLALPYDPSVSTVHATIGFRDGRYTLTTRGRNPSRLNGRGLKNGVEEAIADGDQLELGGSVVEVIIKSPDGVVRKLSFTMLEDIARDLSAETISFRLSLISHSRFATRSRVPP